MSRDVIKSLITFLKADTEVAALVSTRVYGGSLPRSESDSAPRKSLVLQHSGGPSLSYTTATLPVESFRMDARCYGENDHEADKVRRAVYAALKGLKHEKNDDTLIYWCQPASGPTPLVDVDTDWPFVFQSWQVLSDERSKA